MPRELAYEIFREWEYTGQKETITRSQDYIYVSEDVENLEPFAGENAK